MFAAVNNESMNLHRKMLELIKHSSHAKLRISGLQALREVFICFVKFPQIRVTKSEDIVHCRSMWGLCSLEYEATKWFRGRVKESKACRMRSINLLRGSLQINVVLHVVVFSFCLY